ncbi:hypothetical protein [Staphylococcus pettenkoferi]|uniref:hypothetical protein n=1 Tax=Staphylococcus pettenkoferi TaxID=170573 RepID=UPI000B51C2A9|nr:hypothetical protein [Staphylococcus pettenkoferi]ASE37829.1 hypothetical protein CEP67_11265 [Staphylococcus pettenkoferi]
MKKTAGILLASALLLGACGTSKKEQHEKYQKALRTFVDKDMDNFQKFQKDTRTLKNSELVEELSKTRKSFEKDRDEFDKSTKNIEGTKDQEKLAKNFRNLNKETDKMLKRMKNKTQELSDGDLTEPEYSREIIDITKDYPEKAKPKDENKIDSKSVKKILGDDVYKKAEDLVDESEK